MLLNKERKRKTWLGVRGTGPRLQEVEDHLESGGNGGMSKSLDRGPDSKSQVEIRGWRSEHGGHDTVKIIWMLTGRGTGTAVGDR